MSPISHYYIHIPFCRQKCLYCKFPIAPLTNPLQKKRYLGYLRHEIEDFFVKNSSDNSLKIPHSKIHSIYFGGGTPSLLLIDELSSILACFPENDFTSTEITIETNPEEITYEKIQSWTDLGVNRISIGIQSLDDRTLHAVHREDSLSIMRALDRLGDFFVKNTEKNIVINTDWILGLPYTESGATLDNIKKFHQEYPFIDHMSVYMLEDGLYPPEWRANSLTDAEIRDEFMAILEYFECANWHHYEVSNFSKNGSECVHNQAYWNHSEYRGFGLGASSLVSDVRFANSDSFAGYYRGESSEDTLDMMSKRIEGLMFGLRTSGWRIDPELIDLERLHEYLERDLLIQKNDRIFVTKTGIFSLDHIISELLI